MAEDAGMAVRSCVVEICRETDQEMFGQVQKIELQVGEPQSDSAIKSVEKIVVGKPDISQESAQEAVGSSIIRQSLLEETGRLRRKIASYYDLEEAYVEIQIVERER